MKKPSFKQIKEVCLYVKNLQKAEDFFNGKLHFPIISRVEGRHIFFKAGSSVLLCFIAEITAKEEELPPHYAEGKQHLAFEVALSEYNDLKRWFLKNNITITHTQKWGARYESFYFEDLEGNVLEVVPEGMWEY